MARPVLIMAVLMSVAPHIEDDAQLVGRVLGGSYRIVGLIDRGGHGRVYAAEHVRIGTPLAVKMLIGASAHDDERLALFAQEAETLACLRHPHVVSILDFDFVDGQPYFVMERLDGETLFARLRRVGALTVAEAVRIAEQIGSGLAAAHGAGIVHRDLKPGNVFLVSARGEPDFVKLLDFGISKSLFWHRRRRRPEWFGELVGTPHYMAPEQVSGRGMVDERTDQFALAVVTWEMLTGDAAFLGDDVSEILQEIARGEPPRLDDDFAGVFPPELDPVLARAMAPRRHDRYPDVASFVMALREATGLPAMTTFPPAASSAPRLVSLRAPESSGVAVRGTIGRARSAAPMRRRSNPSEPTLDVRNDDELPTQPRVAAARSSAAKP